MCVKTNLVVEVGGGDAELFGAAAEPATHFPGAEEGKDAGEHSGGESRRHPADQ